MKPKISNPLSAGSEFNCSKLFKLDLTYFKFSKQKKNKIIMITLVLVIMFFLLSISLGTTILLPNTNLPLKDVLIIASFVAFFVLTIIYLDLLEKVKLDKEISIKHHQIQAILNSTPFAMFLKDLNGNILFANDYYMELPRYKPKTGANIGNLYKIPEASLAEDRDVIENKKHILTERQIDALDIPLGWYRLIKAPVFDDNGDVINIVVIAQNIDEERKRENQKSAFIATLTHDFKTPTVAQMRTLELLLKNSFGNLTKSQSQIISQVKDSCCYMYNLIFTILDTYVYENGRIKIDYTDFDWQELVASTAREISNMAEQKNQKLSLVTKGEVSNVVADKYQMKRVLTNLISNAITHGDENSKITLTTKCNNERLIFEVRNKSKQIPQSKLDHIFEKFQSAEIKLSGASTGLGLYLVKRIITAHSGKVTATSTENNTCMFSIEIPIVPTEAERKNAVVVFD